MAQYDPHRIRGYDGYGLKEPTSGGRQAAAIMEYSATSESYMASTEEVIRYGGYPTRPDLQIWPRTSTHYQPKSDEYYNHSPNDSPRKAYHRAISPPTGHHSSKYGPHLVASPHDYPHSPKFNHANSSPRDSPRKNTPHVPNNPTAGHYPRKYGNYPNDSPRKNFRDDRRAGFSSTDDDSSDDDDVECRDGVCYPKPTHGGGGHVDYGKDKKKGNGNYAAGNYPLQHSNDYQPRKDPYRRASDGHSYSNTDEKLPQGNNIYGSHSYNAPPHTIPTTDAYYDDYTRPKTDHQYAVPPPIKTRSDRRDGGKNSPVSAMAQWTPFASSPRKGIHQGKAEMIDSAEAQRRYGSAPPQVERRSGAAIDSKTAARKYGGVFMGV